MSEMAAGRMMMDGRFFSYFHDQADTYQVSCHGMKKNDGVEKMSLNQDEAARLTICCVPCTAQGSGKIEPIPEKPDLLNCR